MTTTAPARPSHDRFAEVRARVPLDTYLERECGAKLHHGGSGRLVCLCPLPGHDERTPSFRVYSQDAHWHCYGCGEHGDIVDLHQALTGCTRWEAIEQLEAGAGPAIITRKPQALSSHQEPPKPVPAEIVLSWHRALLVHSRTLSYLAETRCWSRKVIETARVGLNMSNHRFTLPVEHPQTSEIVDVRQYRPGARNKMLPCESGRGAWPYIPDKRVLKAAVIAMVEGESDCLAALSAGVSAVSNTCGSSAAAGVWWDWGWLLSDSTRVLICFDNDTAGMAAAEKIAPTLGDRARVLTLPEPGWDVTDAIRARGPEWFRAWVEAA